MKSFLRVFVVTALSSAVIAPCFVFAQTGLVPPPAPLLTALPGVLPTSTWYVLDRFDEWMQRNVFTFGLSSLRAQVEISQAAERIAELQALDDAGTRTTVLTNTLLKKTEVLLVSAATRVGSGSANPLLADAVVRTTLACVDALERLFEQTPGEDHILGLQEGDTLDMTSDDVLSPAVILDRFEDHIFHALMPTTNALSPQLQDRIARVQLARIERDVVRTQHILDDRLRSGEWTLAGTLLLQKAEADTKNAEQSLRDLHPDSVFAFTTHARTINHLLLLSSLHRTRPELTGNGGEQQGAILLSRLVAKGLLSLPEQEEAYAAFLQARHVAIAENAQAIP